MFGWIRVFVNKRQLKFAAAGSLGIYPVCFIDVQNCSEMHLLSFLGVCLLKQSFLIVRLKTDGDVRGSDGLCDNN